MKRNHIWLIIFGLFSFQTLKAQDTDLLKLAGSDSTGKQRVTMAFKSSRVINQHSMEFIPKKGLDFRILHRFGPINSGFENFYGLDEANFRFGFDYGLGKSLTIGIGRSNVNKEWDGFIKYRPVWQTEGGSPVSLVWVSGMTVNTTPWTQPDRKNYFSSRLGFYHELIIGRKFSQGVTFQMTPVFVHRNLVDSAHVENDTWALGFGGRIKMTKRTAFVFDYHAILAGKQPGTYNPLSLGVDIETGGHVFQLHVSNATGMNEKAFLTNTTDDFWSGDIRFGFNISRMFNTGKKKNKVKS